MAREQASINAAQHYGPRETNTGLDNKVTTYGVVQQRELYFDYEQANAGLPTANANTDAGTLTIPAKSLIKAAYLEVDTAWTSAGAATLDLGVQQTDGTVVDADGLDNLAKAVLTANSWHVLDGALIGATVGTNDVQISIDDVTATFTAGKARLIVEYMEPYAA